ncbi:7-cyano-7-deazaguanine reductase [Acetobacter orientalis]|uniref:7-cyano-7-deazaguanine reductase n=1 Tax=Acetobacter orientalis TaxID=146474 RepID=A0A2Z5ZKI7_9PROT|nr:7-cyano-7-deazaguanine reductase [Acetobacter orientalis]
MSGFRLKTCQLTGGAVKKRPRMEHFRKMPHKKSHLNGGFFIPIQA